MELVPDAMYTHKSVIYDEAAFTISLKCGTIKFAENTIIMTAQYNAAARISNMCSFGYNLKLYNEWTFREKISICLEHKDCPTVIPYPTKTQITIINAKYLDE